MKRLITNLLGAALCFTTVALSAADNGGGPGGTTPGPEVPHAAAEVRVATAGANTKIGSNAETLAVLVTVLDATTGSPVTNLAKSNFLIAFAAVNGFGVCPATPPIVKTLVSNVPGVYQLTIGFSGAGCSGWFKGEFPLALRVYSTFNPLILNSPASYQGQVATTVEIQ